MCPRIEIPNVLAIGLVVILSCANAELLPATEESSPLFEQQVALILSAFCWNCHGGESRQAGLDLRSLPLILQGGKSGPAIVRGSAENSLLFQKLIRAEMPPGDVLKPSQQHIETIRRWLEEGGALASYNGGLSDVEAPRWTDNDRNWWAFRKLQPQRPPVVKAFQRAHSPVDLFLQAKLSARQLGFSPPAHDTALIRRVFFDLTGLPPTPRQVIIYLAGQRPDKYQRLIDRLLASPAFGERWGRHWLDGAGYADIAGRDANPEGYSLFEGIWRYRDFVVESLNEDKPFDQFIQEQLAGDEMVNWRDADIYTAEIKRHLVATGLLRLQSDVTRTALLNMMEEEQHQTINELITLLGTNLLGLTVQCARCHTHKYDPISQLDYYRLRAIFSPAYNPYD